MTTSQRSVRRPSRTGACLTSMNSRKMTRTLTSAITIALDRGRGVWPERILTIERTNPYRHHRDRRQGQPDDKQSLLESGVHGSPHDIEQCKDEDPEEVDGVPVGGARFDELLGAPRGAPELVDDDAEEDEADQEVKEVEPVRK